MRLKRAPRLGGLIEFYRSPSRAQWSPTGTNVPDYPKLAQLWGQNIGDASSGAKTAQEALDSLCAQQEKILKPIQPSGIQGDLGPVMNDKKGAEYWPSQPGAPKEKRGGERDKPLTASYDDLIASWK